MYGEEDVMTYMMPTAKIPTNASLCLLGAFNLQSIGIGRTNTAISRERFKNPVAMKNVG